MIGLFKENTKIALKSIKSQSLRTALTIVIIAIGIWALVGILTVVDALNNSLLKNFASMGANTFSITQYDFSSQLNQDNNSQKANPVISYNQANRFVKNYNFPFTTPSISFEAAQNIELKFDNKKTDPEINILGIDEHYLNNKGIELSLGRNFSTYDISNNSSVCLLGSNLKAELFEGLDPIGKTISIRGRKFTVLGLLKEKGATFGKNQDLRVLIPIGIARSMFSVPNVNYIIDVRVEKEQLLNNATDEAILQMRKIRSLHPIMKDNFGIRRSDDLIERILENTELLSIIAWVIGVITVFGSSIALMNIMLVSVSERTREIGIRKSLGAKRKTIAGQFFTETFVIGQLGGIIGIILGIITGSLIAMAFGFSFNIPWIAIIAAFITTFIVTIFSGLYPAIKASRLDPVEALRYE